MIELQGKYAIAKIFATTIEDGVYQQVYDIINSKAFDGQSVVCMPDVHVGASGPCGLVATIGDYVCPEHIGVDIGCSVSMLVLDKKLMEDKYREFEHRIKQSIPFGFNIHENSIIDEHDFFKFLTREFNRYRNYWPEMLSDLPNIVTEKWVSSQLSRIGMDEATFYKSLGTVGGGNHFIEYDEQSDGTIAGVVLHFGSRNFGVKVCKYWMNKTSVALSKEEVRNHTKIFKEKYIKSHGRKNMINFKEDLNTYLDSLSTGHINGYLNGENLKGYLQDMCFCQLYAQYNHMTVQRVISKILAKYNINVVRTITSVHNFIDLHDHVLRKSAIRSYAGEEMIVPFNMRDGIAICEGLSNVAWLNSCAHGAGRKMSRSKAKSSIDIKDFIASMRDVYSTSVCEGTIDESPMAYKDTDEISNLILETCKIKTMLKPKINIKAVE